MKKENRVSRFSGDLWHGCVSSIFIGGIERRCFMKGIREQFNMFDIIVDIHIRKKQGIFRGFAFVHYKYVKDDGYLLDLKPDIHIGGRKIFLEWACKPCDFETSQTSGLNSSAARIHIPRVSRIHIPRVFGQSEVGTWENRSIRTSVSQARLMNLIPYPTRSSGGFWRGQF